jgi:hypothetical protein
MRNVISGVCLIAIGACTVNYWLTEKLGIREPLVDCWPILDPLIGFCL